MTRRRRVLGALLTAACGAAVLAGVGSGTSTPRLEEAADTSQFRPGNIISDQLFFDGGAMSAADVQRFLEDRNPTCVAAADGTPCLQDARQDTWTRPADAYCPGTYVGAPAETAATIIAKVGAACGVSQRVLLVILQKEQGLVTRSGGDLTARRYERAMGFGCPDTAPCDPRYAHLFNQLYSAASRYRFYAANPGYLGRRVGQVVPIQYHPNAACGSAPVLLENQATVGLYNYTPYQPNAAALAAGRGTGDGCSAYGNRNFWIFFTDWFGSTQAPGAAEVAGRYARSGGATGPLGATTGTVQCGLRNGGCIQNYAKGSIYWSQATGARIVWHGAVRDKWSTYAWEAGPLGYPTVDGVCGLAGGGCYQAFEGGSLYWSPATGARFVTGAVRDRWGSLGFEFGALGYPVTDQATTPNGAAQYVHFQRGSIYWSAATGARVLSGAVYARWAAAGWETSAIGLPVTDVAPTPDGAGTYAHFRSGSIYATAATGARVIRGEVAAKWAATGWERGPLGYPVTDQASTPNGAAQYVHFQHGSVYWSPTTGARRVAGPVRDAWAAGGWETGALGLPTSDVGTTPDGAAQYAHFQRGSVYATSTGAHVLPSAVVAVWARSGWERGALGYPTGPARTTGGVTTQEFQRGVVHVSDAGGFAVHDALLPTYRAAGGPAGALGAPTSDTGTTPDGRARYQHFRGGSIYATATGGARVLPTAFRDAWAASGWERGPLGYPTGDVLPTADGLGEHQRFETGSVHRTRATGTHVLHGAVLDAWTRAGSATGPLGHPTTSVTVTPDRQGRYAYFQGGAVYSSPVGGARVVRGAVLDAWAGTGWEQGRLGYPVGDARDVAGGTRQDFQRGWITVDGATGVATVQVG